jgi:hypothetical protein
MLYFLHENYDSLGRCNVWKYRVVSLYKTGLLESVNALRIYDFQSYILINSLLVTEWLNWQLNFPLQYYTMVVCSNAHAEITEHHLLR